MYQTPLCVHIACAKSRCVGAYSQGAKITVACQLYRDGMRLGRLMMSAREVIQESTRFSPNNLVFRHTVHRLLVVSQADWKEADVPVNLSDYVNGFRQCLWQLHSQ